MGQPIALCLAATGLVYVSLQISFLYQFFVWIFFIYITYLTHLIS